MLLRSDEARKCCVAHMSCRSFRIFTSRVALGLSAVQRLPRERCCLSNLIGAASGARKSQSKQSDSGIRQTACYEGLVQVLRVLMSDPGCFRPSMWYGKVGRARATASKRVLPEEAFAVGSSSCSCWLCFSCGNTLLLFERKSKRNQPLEEGESSHLVPCVTQAHTWMWPWEMWIHFK